jgi:hypothetical protein
VVSTKSAAWSLATSVLERRLRAYAETAAEAVALLARDLRRRVLGAAMAVAGVLMSLILGGAWIVGTVWNTPWRNPVLTALLGLFLVCAVIGATIAAWPFRPAHGPFARLREQLGGDLSLLSAIVIPERLDETHDAAAPDLFMRGRDGPSPHEAFPRSTVMRVLLGFSGLARIFR